MPFPYKTVLITGATAGIGLALAERMIGSGIFVIAVGRRQDRLNALVAKHGADKVAAEVFDVSDVDAIPEWAKRITATHPSLDSIVLNAGLQRTIDFTRPDTVSVSSAAFELRTNYLSPLATVAAFLPHLTSSPDRPASIVLVSSGLALIPHPRCPNYCASKAALHSLAWSLRAQLSASSSPGTHHIRVIEIIPPAVQTELHELQPDLVAAGQARIGLPLQAFADETWALLAADEELDEVVVTAVRDRFSGIEVEKRKGFELMKSLLGKG
ncbi:short chain dehydrogenase [Phialemonium atrogriseum]|uniref:Short chain dehydrogenase n=1 Tax=Phialemonium atrogriseum TaxID=1093897 RepID=A0AAJ0FS37_9PEZI|nr:short chain dehydrogenase [Phialemonium atrogriseum]KAK1770775.1 short chain dehydrogenase [Phialemonium atrogriseum]